MALISLRYARALADASGDHSTEIQHELESFLALLGSSPELKEVLLNPTIAVATRVRVLRSVAARIGMGKTASNFVAVLIGHERLNRFREILSAFRAELDRRQGIVEAEIITARRLEAGERTELEHQVEALAGSRVRTSFLEDDSLLGGIVIQMGSTVYDGSVKGRLHRMREHLTED